MKRFVRAFSIAVCAGFAVSGHAAQEIYDGGNTAFAHLEADIAETTSVAVTLTRSETEAAQGKLVATFPGGIPSEVAVNWEADVTSLVVSLPVPAGLSLDDGATASLSLRDAGDTELDTSALWLVEHPENSPANPYWIGERTAETLDWGEWTMDLDVARAKAKQGGSLILFFTGELWCPRCLGMETNFFEKAEFKSFAKANKLVFAILDNPKRAAGDSATSPAAGPVGAPPTLLRPEVGSNGRSGLPYLTRKMIAQEEAEAVLVRNHKLGYNDANGRNSIGTQDSVAGFRAPGGYRTGYPSLLLVRDDGTVSGRLTIQKWRENGEFLVPLAENLARFNELLKLSGDPGEEADNYITTTPLTAEAGTEIVTSLQVNDKTDVYKLTGITAGKILTCTMTDPVEPPFPVTLKLVSRVDGVETELASGTGSLTVKLETEGEVFLSVSSFSDFVEGFQGSAYPDGGDSSEISVTVSTKMEGEPDATMEPQENGSYRVNLYQFFEVKDAVIPATTLTGKGKIKLKLTEGKLPSGLKVSFNASSRQLVIGGIPKTIGAFPPVVYEVTEKNGAVERKETFTISFYIRTPDLFNAYANKAYTLCDIPMTTTYRDTTILAGLLKLSLSAKGAVMAKYKGFGRKQLSFKGCWSALNTVTGVISCKADGMYGSKLSVELLPDACVNAVLTDPKNALASTLTSIQAFSAWDSEQSADAYKGKYTATLPENTASTLNTKTMEELSAGTAIGTIPLSFGFPNAAAALHGRMKYSGYLPDGTHFNGAATIQELKNDAALLPIFCQKGKITLTTLLRIRKNAKETFEDNRFVVQSVDDVTGFLYATKPYPYSRALEAYGCYYDLSEDLQICCDTAYEATVMVVSNGVVAASSVYGAIAGFPSVMFDIESKTVKPFKNTPADFKFALNAKTGFFSGSFKLPFANGKSIRSVYRGVLQPGIWDCGCTAIPLPNRPFGSGAYWFTDKYQKKTVKRGGTFDLNPMK